MWSDIFFASLIVIFSFIIIADVLYREHKELSAHRRTILFRSAMREYTRRYVPKKPDFIWQKEGF